MRNQRERAEKAFGDLMVAAGVIAALVAGAKHNKGLFIAAILVGAIGLLGRLGFQLFWRSENRVTHAFASDGSVILSFWAGNPLLTEVVADVRFPSGHRFSGHPTFQPEHRFAELRLPDEFEGAPHGLEKGRYRVHWMATRGPNSPSEIVGHDRFRAFRSHVPTTPSPPTVAADSSPTIEERAPLIETADLVSSDRTPDLLFEAPDLALSGLRIDWVQRMSLNVQSPSIYAAPPAPEGDHYARLIFRGWNVTEPIEFTVEECWLSSDGSWEPITVVQPEKYLMPNRAAMVSLKSGPLSFGSMEYVMRFAVGSFRSGEVHRYRHRVQFFGTPEPPPSPAGLSLSFALAPKVLYEWSTDEFEWLDDDE